MAGIAYGNGAGGDVADDDGAGPDGDVVADGDAREYGDAAAYPDVVADGDGQRPLLSRVTLDGVGAVTGGVYADVGTDEAVVADGHGGLVEDGEVEVGKEPFAHTNLTKQVNT